MRLLKLLFNTIYWPIVTVIYIISILLKVSWKICVAIWPIALALFILDRLFNKEDIPMEKRLHKSATDRKICGVCGGIAEYFNIDSTFVRVITAVMVLGWGSGLLVYIIAAICMPEA